MKLRRYKLSGYEGLVVLKHDTVKERVVLNHVVVGLSSWMRSLACGKGKDGRIFCKVDYYQCGVEAIISSHGWMQLRYD